MKLTAGELAARHPYPQWRFLQLTLAIFAAMIISPRLEHAWLSHLIIQVVMLDVMLVTLWANPDWAVIRRIVVGLLLLSFLASVIANLQLPPAWIRVNETMQAVLHLPIIAACVIGVLTFVFRSERPTLDGIFATVVAYLLVAMIFLELYNIVLAWSPEALRLLSPLDELTPQARGGQLFYFSIITLATVGYGDILPNSEVTRMMAAIEAVIGQFYVAVVVAVFVGMYANQAQEAMRSRRAQAPRDD